MVDEKPILKVERKEIVISQLDKGYLVNVFDIAQNRQVVKKRMLAFSKIDAEENIIPLIKKEFGFK